MKELKYLYYKYFKTYRKKFKKALGTYEILHAQCLEEPIFSNNKLLPK